MVIGCLYKHPNVGVLDFKNNYLNQIFGILPKERKHAFLLGNFNINHLNYNDHQPTNDFLIRLPLILLFRISYIQLELLVIQKLSLTIYFPIISLMK